MTKLISHDEKLLVTCHGELFRGASHPGHLVKWNLCSECHPRSLFRTINVTTVYVKQRCVCVYASANREVVKVATPVNFRAVSLIWDTQAGQVIVFNTVWTFLFIVAVIFTCPVSVGKGSSLHRLNKEARWNNNLLNYTFPVLWKQYDTFQRHPS